MEKIQKILIVGGGPAGLMTALILSEQPVELTLIEKYDWPIDKVCGEGIMPKGLEILKKYGVAERISNNAGRFFTGITYFDAVCAVGKFKSGSGYVVRRTALSQALHDAVKARQNVRLLSNTELIAYQQESESLSVSVRQGRNMENLSLGQFDLIIGCDGLRSKVRKLAGLETAPLGKQNRIGARVHFQIAPWSTQVEVYWSSGIECYVVPVADDCIEFVFGWNQDLLQIKTGRPNKLRAKLFSYFPQLASIVEAQVQLSELEAIGSFARQAVTSYADRVVLIGDANFFLDPITGEGLSMAFEQAEILGQFLPVLHRQAGGDSFRLEILKLKRRYLRVTRILLFLSQHYLLRQFILVILVLVPKLFQHLLEVNMGSRGIPSQGT